MNLLATTNRARLFLHLALLAPSVLWAQASPQHLPPEPAPPISTTRSPRAEEVGKVTGKKGPLPQFAPLPGLPLDTSFGTAGWIPQGPGLTKLGDCNIAPDHPTSGGVSAIVPHPTNQNILYIGTVNGGVWKTTNALAANVRWKPLTDDQLSLSIGGMALDRSDATGNTLVAGYGRRSSLSGIGGAQKGVIRTTDGGATWTRLGETDLAGRSIYDLAVRGNTMLLAVPSTDNGTLPGVYRTTDGGTTFTNMSGTAGLPAGACMHLAADPTDGTRYFVHIAGNGIYRTLDSGATWSLSSFAPSATYTIAVGNDGTVYAATLAATSFVQRSTTNGASWSIMGTSPTVNMSTSFNGIAVDPTNSGLVYLSGLYVRSGFPFSGRVLRGAFAGNAWTSIASTGVQGVGTAPHTDSRVMVFTAGNRLLEGNDGGIYELNIANVGSEGDGAGGGGTWRSLNGDLHSTEMHSMAYDRVSRLFIGGTQDTAFQEQIIPGITTAGAPGWKNTSNGDGGDTGIDFITLPGQSIRYGSSQRFFGFFRATFDANGTELSRVNPATTLSGGGTAIIPGTNMPFTTPVAMNAVAGGRLIISGNANVYESLNQGDTVTQIDTAGINTRTKFAYGGKLGGVANPAVLFFGSGGNVRYRTAAGNVTGNIAFPGGAVQGVAFDPENWKTTYITGSTSVYLANDIPANGAAAFTDITGNLTGVGTMHTVEYLTLPSGNAIMVGTDLGAYIMRVAAPGVWKTLGDNMPHAPLYDSHFDAAGQVLAISTLGRGAWLYDFKPVKTTSQYGETFQAYADGTTSFDAGAGELFSNQLGTAGKISDDKFRELRLTADGVGGTLSAFRLPDLNPGASIAAFSAKWNATIFGDSTSLADGFSFNLGPLGAVAGPALIASGALEDGFGSGLAVGVRTFASNTPGYYVRLNGTVVPGGFVSKTSSTWGNFNSARHFFEVDWRIDTGLTLRVDGVAIFTNLPTPGFLPASGHRFVFGARTGGLDEEVRLDNLAIFTGGVLTRATATSPYYFSADFPATNQTADKTFDGNAATKWLAQDYTGFVGASFAAAKTIRAYTLLCGEDVPGRDLVSWDFQTGDNGTKWVQHGAQAAQYFVNRSEQRAFVVASPASNSKFRMHISENASAAEIQLSEFQPWELITPTTLFTVTNPNDSGAGSLRQAIASAAAVSGAFIYFDPSLSGLTITLAGEIIASNTSTIIDARGLPAGLTIDGGPGTNRILTVLGGANLTLNGLTFTGGNGGGAAAIGYGGAILNSGTLTVNACTFTGNAASAAANGTGGAIMSDGSLTLNLCTLTGNTSNGWGGALFNLAAMTVNRCTISGNSAAQNGGGIDNGGNATDTLTVTHSIISGNNAVFSGPDVYNFNGTVTRVGTSIVPGYGGIAAVGTGTFSAADPFLAPLDNYGGPTKTLALQPGSPARNTATGSTLGLDQRGFPIIGTADLGAYEAGTLANYNAFIWETLPASATIAQHATTADYDGDSASNFNEWLAFTNAADPASLFRIVSAVPNAANLDVTFTTVAGRHYSLESTTDFVTWTNIPGAERTGTGNPIVDPIGPVSSFTKLFVRARVGP